MTLIDEEEARRADELKRIRLTDNSVRPDDGVQPPQDAKPLELDSNGLPKNIIYGCDDQ